MDIQAKIKILSAAAKYDVSCSSSASKRGNTASGIGNAAKQGICHSWSADGRCISLLKILFSNDCIYDCKYCANRRSNDIERATFSVDELIELTINFYRRNFIEGLFLSSGIVKGPDHTMEQLIQAAKKLREKYSYNGYIHLKAIPGADQALINQAGLYADRISVNLELPTERSLKLLAPQKDRQRIDNDIRNISRQIAENRADRKKFKNAPAFVPAGQSTQLIIGATPENDHQIIKLSEGLYQEQKLKRVYYSAYIPVNRGSQLPSLTMQPPLVRENRLYQADWLLRFYKFKADEILSADKPFFDPDLDPKAGWAVRNPQYFPIEINKADYEQLLRVPGIGVLSAQRIVGARRFGRLSFDDLKKFGIVLKRAKFFITCSKTLENFVWNNLNIRNSMLTNAPYQQLQYKQLKLLSA